MEENNHGQYHQEAPQKNLAFSATLHCLLGCGIGEVIGMIIGKASTLIISNY